MTFFCFLQAEAKKAIVVAEQKMLEVQEEQTKVLKEIHTSLEEYAAKMNKRGKKVDLELLYGAANRFISMELEKTVAKVRTKKDASRMKGGSIVKHKRPFSKSNAIHAPIATPLEPFSLLKNLKDLPSVINSIREPVVSRVFGSLRDRKQYFTPKSNSLQIKNSRMNLLEALKKAKDASEMQQEAESMLNDDDSDSSVQIVGSELDDKIGIIPITDDDDEEGEDDDVTKLPESIKNDFEFVGTIEEIPDDVEDVPETSVNNRKELKSGSSSEKSSRRSSDFEDLIVGQPDESLEDLGQERFLKYFGLYTPEQVDQLKTRRVSRRRRNCTSNVRKDFHYGQFDVNYVPVKNNKPMLYSPVDRVSRYPKRKQQMEPLPIVGPASKIIITVPPQQSRKSVMRVSTIVEAAIYKDMKTCVACQQISDVETMNACLLCYNFYHLQCHTMDRELRERENLCPDCLKQGLEKKKRRMELKKRLNFQVLQANHKASIAASMKTMQELQT